MAFNLNIKVPKPDLPRDGGSAYYVRFDVWPKRKPPWVPKHWDHFTRPMESSFQALAFVFLDYGQILRTKYWYPTDMKLDLLNELSS